jgi:hypothetical protein
MTHTAIDHEERDDAVVARWLETDLDQWVRDIVRRHFDPVSGAPFWLARAKEFDFEPRDITRYEELTRLGPFPLAELRLIDPAALIPRDNGGRTGGRVWETGGTTGDPKRLLYSPATLDERSVWRRWNDRRAGFRRGGRWLNAMPTGPHIAGAVAPSQALWDDCQVYGIDMDPRWARWLIEQNRHAEAQEYTLHLVRQVASILASVPIDYLATTPALLRVLCDECPDRLSGLLGARISGTQITTAMMRAYRTAVGEHFSVLRRYGNTLADPAMGLGMGDEAHSLLPYQSAFPHTVIDVVEPDEWTSRCDYGSFGRVRVTVLRADIFLPNMLERDEAVRLPAGDWPYDRLANVRPLAASKVAQGLLY